MEQNELHRLCVPVVEYMKKNCSPHDTIVITDEQYKLVADEVVMLVSGCGESEDVSNADVRISPWMEQREMRETKID
ncbi:MAG: hypothetical protein IJ510_01730 [Selenomonadales bacterium]|nr:hypothetical protein [Selenomonadales bacterium]